LTKNKSGETGGRRLLERITKRAETNGNKIEMHVDRLEKTWKPKKDR
jgi:hypothetical protein